MIQLRLERHELDAIRDAVREKYPNATVLLLKLNEAIKRAKPGD
jgi:hypothetical protein